MDKYPKYISQEQQEIFESYLLGKMTAEQELGFTKKLKESEEVQKQFEEFKNLFLAVEEGTLRASLDDFHQHLEEKPKSQGSKFNFLRIAASIAVLVTLSIWFFTRPNANEKLYNEYFTPDPGLPTVMGDNDNYAFYEAMVDYKQGNYDMAIQKWKKLHILKPENDTLNFFIGAAHMANKNPEESITYLEKNQENLNSSFNEETKYFLALAYLHSQQIEKAKKTLKDLKLKKAQKLLSELNNQ